MPKILITGCSGYLGSTFLSYVPKEWEIVGFDLKKPAIKLPPNFTFVKGDIRKVFPEAKFLKKVDVVLHFAAIKGTERCQANPAETIEINVLGTHNLLKAALHNQVDRFIFASTYWVYDTCAKLPFTEDTPIRPSELYGLSKAISEIEIAKSKINYIILRFTNIFGMGSGVGMEEVIFNFIKNAIYGKPIDLFGNGSQKCDFVDVGDVCRCLVKIIDNPKISRCVLNIGSGQPRSIASVAQTIRKIFKNQYTKHLTIRNLPCNQPIPDRWVSIENLEKKIGKVNLTPFEKSIESYIQECMKQFTDAKNSLKINLNEG